MNETYITRLNCTLNLLQKFLKVTIEKNEELEKEKKRLNKLTDELLNENKAYKRVVAEWRTKDAN